ncbi:hypothetical protein GOODEAATRI_034618 [Goodea atripinnis]|uniref:Uncharacterized protein n=1 Tax=Goodea atripinnis TaxID=208336 RepID=A0ABV0MXH9_9TELE
MVTREMVGNLLQNKKMNCSVFGLLTHTDSHDVNKVKECLENAVKVTGADITQPKPLGPFITLAIQVQVQQRDQADAEKDKVGVLHQGKYAREADKAEKKRKYLMQCCGIFLLKWIEVDSQQEKIRTLSL